MSVRGSGEPALTLILGERDYLRRWSALHGGTPAKGLVGWWLRLSYRLGRPLARLGVRANAVTVAGLLVSVAVLAPAAAGGRWVLLAVPVVALAGLLDNLDGAVAVITGRATKSGYVLDSVCDRLSDAAYAAALWVVGAPAWVAVSAAGLAWLQEYLRARAGAAGVSEVGVVSVSERPTRVIVTVMFLLGAGLYPGSHEQWATVGAATWAAVGVVGFVQTAVVLGRRLRAAGPA
ncbi:MAG: CDP-alcohol phosphatidyltransferase family protein [Kineosporiaceae bacterium]